MRRPPRSTLLPYPTPSRAGYVVRDEPVLLLVDDNGHAAPLLGSELISQLRDLSRLPRLVFLASCQSAGAGADRRSEDAGRSEEHTSELQSRQYLVCRLLLE